MSKKWVRLEGEVSWQYQKERPGVAMVENHISVQP
jgi:hypothetical protein